MAGANNRSLKAAGIPKSTIQTLRVESGGRLSLRSAIGMAHERNLPVGKAVEHMAKRDARQASSKEGQAAAGDFRTKAAERMRAAAAERAVTERKAALQAAMTKRQGNLARTVGAASSAMLAARKAAAKPTFERSLSKFKEHAQGVIDNYYKTNFPKQTPPTLHYSDGEKYIRVTRVDAGGKTGSAHAFIDKATGDVLKPDGYKRPAKGARGNIHTGDFGVGPHGANYSETYMKRRFNPEPPKHGGFTRSEAVAAAKKASFSWKNAEGGGYVSTDGRSKIVRENGGWMLHGPNGYKRRVAKGASLEHATAMLVKAGVI
jgi:hypothetical protein